MGRAPQDPNCSEGFFAPWQAKIFMQTRNPEPHKRGQQGGCSITRGQVLGAFWQVCSTGRNPSRAIYPENCHPLSTGLHRHPDPLDLPARPGRGLRSAATAPGLAPPHYSPWAGRSECRDGRRRSRRSWRQRPGPAPLRNINSALLLARITLTLTGTIAFP